MNSKDLTREQLERLGEIVGRQLRYYNKLADRMNRVGFVPSDRLMFQVQRTQGELQALRMEIHYLAVGGGVG